MYGDYKDKKNQTLVNILGTLLHQFLATTQKPVPDEITEKLREIRRENGKIGFQDNLALLKIQLHQLKFAFICIDAIDELDQNVRWKLLKELKELGTKNTRLFLTGRNYIESEVQKQLPSEKNRVIISATRQDIADFVSENIKEDRDQDPEAMDDILAEDISAIMIEKSQGMYVMEFELYHSQNHSYILICYSRFLLSTLHIKMVLGMPTISQRRKALETLPTDLFDSFQEIIARIRESHQGQAKLGIQVLMWLHFAYRPLKLAELQHALAIEKGDTKFEWGNIPSLKKLLD